jgi:hypothetical protein
MITLQSKASMEFNWIADSTVQTVLIPPRGTRVATAQMATIARICCAGRWQGKQSFL